jgi:hypothetical protein
MSFLNKKNEANGSVQWNLSNLGIYELKVILTACPPWFPFIIYIHQVIDAIRILEFPYVIPFPKILGGEVTYQLDIHT